MLSVSMFSVQNWVFNRQSATGSWACKASFLFTVRAISLQVVPLSIQYDLRHLFCDCGCLVSMICPSIFRGWVRYWRIPHSRGCKLPATIRLAWIGKETLAVCGGGHWQRTTASLSLKGSWALIIKDSRHDHKNCNWQKQNLMILHVIQVHICWQQCSRS